jgi:hypothetical protein
LGGVRAPVPNGDLDQIVLACGEVRVVEAVSKSGTEDGRDHDVLPI